MKYIKEKIKKVWKSKSGKIAMMVCALSSYMAIGACAVDVDVTTVAGGITALGPVLSAVVNLALGNPIIAMLFAVGIVGTVWALFKKFKH